MRMGKQHKRQLKEIVRDLPSVMPKMAKWESYDKRIKLWDEVTFLGVRCSKCKTDARLKLSVLLRNGSPCYHHKLEKDDYEPTNYCPNCGARMEEQA